MGSVEQDLNDYENRMSEESYWADKMKDKWDEIEEDLVSGWGSLLEAVAYIDELFPEQRFVALGDTEGFEAWYNKNEKRYLVEGEPPDEYYERRGY
jgi:hypothetical protein